MRYSKVVSSIGLTAHRHRLRTRVEHHRSATQVRRGPAAAPAQQRLQAGQHLLEVEGLGDVIVRAGVETLHLVLPAVARGEDEDGKTPVTRAQLADHVQARRASADRDR